MTEQENGIEADGIEAKKVEVIEFYPNELPEGQEEVDYLYYNVQGIDATGTKAKAKVSFVIPKTDEEAQERYNCSLNDLVKAGVRSGMATRPNYPLEFAGRTTDEKGKVTNRGCINQDVTEACQKLADEYKCGQKAAGGLMKQIKAKAKEKGMTDEDMMKAILAYQNMKAEDAENDEGAIVE